MKHSQEQDFNLLASTVKLRVSNGPDRGSAGAEVGAFVPIASNAEDAALPDQTEPLSTTLSRSISLSARSNFSTRSYAALSFA